MRSTGAQDIVNSTVLILSPRWSRSFLSTGNNVWLCDFIPDLVLGRVSHSDNWRVCVLLRTAVWDRCPDRISPGEKDDCCVQVEERSVQGARIRLHRELQHRPSALLHRSLLWQSQRGEWHTGFTFTATGNFCPLQLVLPLVLGRLHLDLDLDLIQKQ